MLPRYTIGFVALSEIFCFNQYNRFIKAVAKSTGYRLWSKNSCRVSIFYFWPYIGFETSRQICSTNIINQCANIKIYMFWNSYFSN